MSLIVKKSKTKRLNIKVDLLPSLKCFLTHLFINVFTLSVKKNFIGDSYSIELSFDLDKYPEVSLDFGTINRLGHRKKFVDDYIKQATGLNDGIIIKNIIRVNDKITN